MESLKYSPCVEVSLEVSPDIVSLPLGFVIDSGGSLTKLVYRSKEDYERCRKIKPTEHGVLRLKSFTIGELSGLVEYIKKHVDICLREEDKDVVWTHTGVSSKHFTEQLEQELNIKIRLHSEMMALQKCLESHKETRVLFHDTSVDVIKEAAKNSKNFIEMLLKMEKCGEKTVKFEVHEKDQVQADSERSSAFPELPPEHYLMHLVSPHVDYQAWTDKHLKAPTSVETPSLLFLVGSAGVIGKLNSDFSLKFLDYTTSSGKSLCGLAEALLGEKDFTKFVALAEEGNHKKVDQLTDEMNKDNKEDWYASFPEDMVIFELGKLSSNNFDGNVKPSKADLAAGLLSFHIHSLSRLVVSNIRIHKIFNAYVCGSMFQFPLIRKTFERHFYNDSMIPSMEYGQPFKVHFFDHPGYLVSLGVWMQNVQDAAHRALQEA